MNRIETALQALQEKEEKAFITYITAGLPDYDKTKAIIKAQEVFYLLFAGDVRSLAEDMQTLYYSMFAVAAAVGAVSELIVCCIVCPPIVKVISKPGMKRNSHIY